LELVARQVLRSESERLVDVGVEVGASLAGDPVDEIQRDVVKLGITEMVEGAPDVLRSGAALQYREQVRLKALGAEREPRHSFLAQQPREVGRHGLRIRLDRDLVE